jgi:hypothetical protein
MNKIITAIVIAAASLNLQAEIQEIDSSKWKADPVQYGMTSKEFIQAESRAFIANFVDRSEFSALRY